VDERTPLQGGLPDLEFSRQDAREVVRKMLARSPRRPFPPNRRQRLPSEDETHRYDEAFQKVELRLAEVQERARREQQMADIQWLSLANHPPGRRLVMVLNDERLRHWGLYDLLVTLSRQMAPDDPVAAVNLAVLALAIAERLDPQIYGQERVADFRTAALAALGDARRHAGDLAGARLAFSQARINLEMGTGDLLEEANLLSSLVNLLCDLGEYQKAGESLERASTLYRRLGDPRLEGVSLDRPETGETGEIRRQDSKLG
jgi:tetratricopeptide (TPR) repeat protein